MKKIFLAAFIIAALVSCGPTSKNENLNLITKNLSDGHTDWKVDSDTIKKEIQVAFESFTLPLNVTYLTAKDAGECRRIAYFKLDKLSADAELKISNININHIPCASKWEDKDTTKFETLIVNAELNGKKGIKDFNYKGKIIQLNGLGEMEVKKND